MLNSITDHRLLVTGRRSRVADPRSPIPGHLPVLDARLRSVDEDATIATPMTDELTPSQAAARIGATTRSVQRWIARGILPARRVGGRWRVASDALVAFTATEVRTTAADERTAAADERATAADERAAAIEGRAAAAGGQRSNRAGNIAGTTGPIRRLFIANRGEIATRIARTATRLGMAALIPGEDALPVVDLLDADAVVAAARHVGADAIHPGYGFLAESAAFASAVQQAGIVWVGPPSEAIATMGDKAAARRLAVTLGIPVLSGYDGEAQDDSALLAAAAAIGAPLIVKPAAGGGGKGMRIVRDLAPSSLGPELAAARRTAASAFGDERLILERLVEGARHVEVQVLFDAVGRGVALGDRDCSIQRRHQKVLEEAPAPDLTGRTRHALAEAALRLAAAVGYRNVGTCEFLVADDGSWYFLEMNTRLQVEHPVTEEVIGRDLVADQLAIAGGATLSDLAFDPLRPTGATRGHATRGHAIEVRLYAEDADNDFLPSMGTVRAIDWPGGDAIRVEPGIDVGTEVGPRFDPLLAKIVARGSDRAEALARLTTALDETVVLGLTTNLRFLRWLVRQPAVVRGLARTDSLAAIWPPPDHGALISIPDRAWSTAAARFPALGSAAGDPFARPFRINAPPAIRLATDGEVRTVVVERADPGAATATVQAADVVHVDVGGRSVAFRLAPPPESGRAVGAATSASASGRSGPGDTGGAGAAVLTAPMPGRVVEVRARNGDLVEASQPIVVLEAMKMEHVVPAPIAGRLVELAVAVADQVTRGQRLGSIEPVEA